MLPESGSLEVSRRAHIDANYAFSGKGTMKKICSRTNLWGAGSKMTTGSID